MPNGIRTIPKTYLIRLCALLFSLFFFILLIFLKRWRVYCIIFLMPRNDTINEKSNFAGEKKKRKSAMEIELKREKDCSVCVFLLLFWFVFHSVAGFSYYMYNIESAPITFHLLLTEYVRDAIESFDMCFLFRIV